MVYACNAIAVKPLFMDAKHIFSPLAGPMSVEMCLMLRREARPAPERGTEWTGWGPERGMLGMYQLGGEVREEGEVNLGGWPIIPPSRKRTLGWAENREAIFWAVEGEIALRSRK